MSKDGIKYFQELELESLEIAGEAKPEVIVEMNAEGDVFSDLRRDDLELVANLVVAKNAHRVAVFDDVRSILGQFLGGFGDEIRVGPTFESVVGRSGKEQ